MTTLSGSINLGQSLAGQIKMTDSMSGQITYGVSLSGGTSFEVVHLTDDSGNRLLDTTAGDNLIIHEVVA